MFTGHGPRAVVQQPVRPVVVAGLEVLFDQEATETGAVDPQVAFDALEVEQREAWALERVTEGESVRDTYPISPDRMAEYEAWKEERNR